MLKLTVDVVRSQDPTLFAGLVSKEIVLATVSAINKTLKNTQVEASKQIRRELNLPAAQVKDRLDIHRANLSRQAGHIRVSRRSVPVMAFGARKTSRGISVRIKKTKPRTFFRHAFKATMPSGHTGIFERAPNWRMRYPRRGGGRKHGLPIEELFSTTVLESFQNHIPKLREFTNERLVVNLRAESQYRLAKSLGRTRRGRRTH